MTGLIQFDSVTGTGTVPDGMSASANKFYSVPADLGSPGVVVLWRVRLIDLPDNAEFTSGLFQQYRITGFTTHLIPQITNAEVSTAQITVYTMPYSFKMELESTPLTEAKCLQVQNRRTTQLISSGPGKKFYSRTRVLNDLNAGALVDTRNRIAAPWLPATAVADTNAVEHLGLMQRFQPNNSGTAWPSAVQMKVIITCNIEMRGVV